MHSYRFFPFRGRKPARASKYFNCRTLMNDKARKKTTFPFRILPYTRIRAARYGQGLKDPRLREHYCTARMIPCKPNVLDETQEPTAPCHERLQGSGYFLHK